MRFEVVTLFAEAFTALTEQGVTGRAVRGGLVSVGFHNPRDFTADRGGRVDDRPFGGGPGMVMEPEPLSGAIEAARTAAPAAKVLYLSPQGQPLDQAAVGALAERKSMILLAGRYEGVDQRVIDRCVDEEWSIGDYVLSGGELPAMVLMDAVIRLLPGALGDEASAREDSFVAGLLDHPHYTRPQEWRGLTVPDVLLQGNHEAIRRWRLREALGRTWARRPDLLERIELDAESRALLDDYIRAVKQNT